MLALDKAIELVSQLNRTINYPKEGPGVVNLAKGLQKASDALKIGAGRIIEQCAETSQYCPTDADLMSIARDIARLDGLAAGTFDSMAGASNHEARARVTKCPKCHGSGWEIRWFLHTRETGSHNFVRKEPITEARAKELEGKIDRRTQEIYSGAKRCTCPVQADDWATRAAGDRE